MCCIGEVAELICIEIDKFPTTGGVSFPKEVKRMIGNDATIISIFLSNSGLKTLLVCSSNKTSNYRITEKLEKSESLKVIVNNNKNEVPLNFCLIDNSKTRTWFPSKHYEFPSINNSILSNSNLYYIDLYEEFISQRIEVIKQLSLKGKKIYVNLSATSIMEKIDKIKNIEGISIIQLSLPNSIPDMDNEVLKLYDELKCDVIIITLGHKGSILIDKGKVYKNVLTNTENTKYIASGAKFTSEFILQKSKGLDTLDAWKRASKETQLFCVNYNESIKELLM